MPVALMWLRWVERPITGTHLAHCVRDVLDHECLDHGSPEVRMPVDALALRRSSSIHGKPAPWTLWQRPTRTVHKVRASIDAAPLGGTSHHWLAHCARDVLDHECP